jgi:mRNA-degrading endonuclease toxin of MazEF toxin-antitoxin module
VAGPVKGDVVVVPFPFSNLTASKRRPALVLCPLKGEDVILCQITSRQVKDRDAIPIANEDFVTSGLRQPSNVWPNRLFTADRALVLYKAGSLKAEKLQETIERLVEILRR